MAPHRLRRTPIGCRPANGAPGDDASADRPRLTAHDGRCLAAPRAATARYRPAPHHAGRGAVVGERREDDPPVTGRTGELHIQPHTAVSSRRGGGDREDAGCCRARHDNSPFSDGA